MLESVFRGVFVIIPTLNAISMKVSELLGRTENIEAKLNKVFGEQSKLVEDLKADNAALRSQLSNVDLPEGAVARLDGIDAKLDQIDALIPDQTNTPPATGGDETPAPAGDQA